MKAFYNITMEISQCESKKSPDSWFYYSSARFCSVPNNPWPGFVSGLEMSLIALVNDFGLLVTLLPGKCSELYSVTMVTDF